MTSLTDPGLPSSNNINIHAKEKKKSHGIDSRKKILFTKIETLCKLLAHEKKEADKKQSLEQKKPLRTYHFESVSEGYFKRFVIKLKLGTTKGHDFKKGQNVSLLSNTKPIAEGVVVSIVLDSVDIVANRVKNFTLETDENLYYAKDFLKSAQYFTILPTNQGHDIIQAIDFYKLEVLPEPHIIINILLNINRPKNESTKKLSHFFNMELNREQKDIVSYALSQKSLAIIHGPPGTGKTLTLVEIAMQEIRFNKKVIVCAHSNAAADNITEKLALHTSNIIRIGHPCRQLKSLHKFSLDAALEKNKRNISKFELLKKADVIVSTLAGTSPIGILNNEERSFTPRVVIIDECGQASEADCWLPIHLASKLILSGDFHQLPPTIITRTKKIREQLEYTLMERLHDKLKGTFTKTLKIQYRMHPKIMQWSSMTFYNNELVADVTVSKGLLKDIKGVQTNKITSNPLIYINTKFTGMGEINSDSGNSKGNKGEANLVSRAVNILKKSGVDSKYIGIITPYCYQAEIITNLIKSPDIQVSSVDTFQGKEKDVIILSMVRSNRKQEVGFLKDPRRMNVALTRAKKLLLIIGDSTTISHDKMLKSLITFLKENALTIKPKAFNETIMMKKK